MSPLSECPKDPRSKEKDQLLQKLLEEPPPDRLGKATLIIVKISSPFGTSYSILKS